jgi:hypothetical protein
MCIVSSALISVELWDLPCYYVVDMRKQSNPEADHQTLQTGMHEVVPSLSPMSSWHFA